MNMEIRSLNETILINPPNTGFDPPRRMRGIDLQVPEMGILHGERSRSVLLPDVDVCDGGGRECVTATC